MNQVAPQSQVHPVVRFKQDLSVLIEKKELALPSNVKPEAFRNAAIVAVQDNPEILRCDTASVMKSIRTIAAAGLVPDGREAAIVPFKGTAQAMPMVFGLIKMARRSGDVRDIRAHIVYQKELDDGLFSYVVGDEERLEHKPILFGEKGPAVAAYAIARLKDGTIVREFMDSTQIEKVRKSSPQQRKHNEPSGIWLQWTDEMWKKTVIRRLCKRLDLSSEDLRRIMVDEDQPEPIRDITPEQKPNLAQRLQQQNEAAEPPEQEPGQPIDGEVLPPEEDSQDEAPQIDPSKFEFAEGVTAANNDKTAADCPYDDIVKRDHWLAGFKQQSKLNAEGEG